KPSCPPQSFSFPTSHAFDILKVEAISFEAFQHYLRHQQGMRSGWASCELEGWASSEHEGVVNFRKLSAHIKTHSNIN
ncbi:Calcium-dependent protein kinase 2, partial [Sesbania bispinosa]